MEKDTWGAPIAKGSDVWPGPGKPVWLGARDEIVMHDAKCDKWYGGSNPGCKFYGDDIGEPEDVIRLPASHFAYTVIAWNAAHPDKHPFFPWGGGDESPSDWDGGDGLQRAGGTCHPNELFRPWQNDGRRGDIIGYRATPASTPAPLDEAAQAAIALVERMVTHSGELGHYTEARRIADLPSFPKAVDPVEEAVAAIADRYGWDMAVTNTRGNALRDAVKAGIEIGLEARA